MINQNIRCDACGCAFVPEPKTQREGEIEYSYFNCDYCGKAFMVSVTDAALRRSIRKYRTLAEKLKGKPVTEQTLSEIAALKDANTKRAAELRQMYIRERDSHCVLILNARYAVKQVTGAMLKVKFRSIFSALLLVNTNGRKPVWTLF